VIKAHRTESTRLTEVQARALADWWGGWYELRVNPKNSGEVRHGAIFRQHDPEGLLRLRSPEVAVFSLEEARALENIRDAVNPEAPDWVG